MKKIYLLLLLTLSLGLVQAQTLDSISPNTGYAGQINLNTTISATNLFQTTISPSGNIWEIKLRQGSNVIQIQDPSSWPWSGSVNVLNPNSAAAQFSIPSNAVLGSYDLELTTTDTMFPGSNLQNYSVPSGFTVVAPDGYISGTAYLDANNNGIRDGGESGIAGMVVLLNPGGLQTTTDSNGDYQFGVANGSYTVICNTLGAHAYVLSSGSSSLSVTVNSANEPGKDFGWVEGITSLSPGVGFQGQTINCNVTSRHLFIPGANPFGNITIAYLNNTLTPNVNYANISNTAFVVLDSSNAQLIYSVPPTMPVGTYDLRIRIGSLQYYLYGALTITIAPSYLSGHCYFDSNNNGVYDTGEPPIPHQRVSLSPDSAYGFSDNLGDFTLGAALGTHTLSYSPAGSTNYALTTQPSYTFTNSGNQSGFDFGFRSALPDYSCSYTFSPGFMRCNSSVTSYITYTNTSNVVCQGSVYIIHSANTGYSSSSPLFTSQVGDTIFWDFTNLQPMETRTIMIAFSMPGPGSTVDFRTGIIVNDGSGNMQFHDNSMAAFFVRCSYDPNDKAVVPEGVDDVMHYTLNTDTLDYLIRFQNTGNDTAFTVLIRDTIDASLDLSSLEIIASSHDVQVSVDSNRAVVFTFANILLADSVVDEPNSHGYVQYRIRPLSSLPDPTRVENTAYIYFDLNPAVVTNTSWNTLVQVIPVGISDQVQLDEGIYFYPNPMGEKGTFVFANPHGLRMILELFDVRGQRVSSIETGGSFVEFHRKDLASGLYFYRLTNREEGTVRSGRISIR